MTWAKRFGRLGRARGMVQRFVEQQREYLHHWSLMRDPVVWQEFRLWVAAHCVLMVADERKLTVIEVLAMVDRYVTMLRRPRP